LARASAPGSPRTHEQVKKHGEKNSPRGRPYKVRAEDGLRTRIPDSIFVAGNALVHWLLSQFTF